MLSEAKHLCLFGVGGTDPNLIPDWKPGLADFVRCVAASRSLSWAKPKGSEWQYETAYSEDQQVCDVW